MLFCQVIEGLLHVAAHTFRVVDTIYLLTHYVAGRILFGDRKDLPRHSLPKVKCVLCVYMLVLHGDNVWWQWDLSVLTHTLMKYMEYKCAKNQVLIPNKNYITWEY